MHQLRHLEQSGWANIGTVCEAEEYQEGTSLQVLIADRLAVLILKMERAADRGDRGTDRRGSAAGDEDDRAEKQKQSAEKRGEQKHDARCIHLHALLAVSQSTPQSRRVSFRKIPWCRNAPIAGPCRRAPKRQAR